MPPNRMLELGARSMSAPHDPVRVRASCVRTADPCNKVAAAPHRRNGPIISSGRTHSANCSLVTWPSLSAASRRLVPSRWAVYAICAAFS